MLIDHIGISFLLIASCYHGQNFAFPKMSCIAVETRYGILHKSTRACSNHVKTGCNDLSADGLHVAPAFAIATPMLHSKHSCVNLYTDLCIAWHLCIMRLPREAMGNATGAQSRELAFLVAEFKFAHVSAGQGSQSPFLCLRLTPPH